AAPLGAEQTSVRDVSSFLFHATPTTEIYTLSLHDALPIFMALIAHDTKKDALTAFCQRNRQALEGWQLVATGTTGKRIAEATGRSEEHTSELQSRENLVCRLLLEKKKTERITHRVMKMQCR